MSAAAPKLPQTHYTPSDEAILAADAFIAERLELRDAAFMFIPKVFVLAYAHARIDALKMGVIDPRFMSSGATKDALAKLLRSLRADYPFCVVAFVSEVWHRQFEDSDNAERLRAQRDGIAHLHGNGEAIMIRYWRKQTTETAMREILREPTRLGSVNWMHSLSLDSRFS